MEKNCANCVHISKKGDGLAYCKHEIGSPEGYVCSSWKAKEPESTPLTPSNSTSLNDLCTAAVNKWGAAAQVQKALEELSELQLALIRWMNGKEPASKIREEREDVEIMLRHLDVIFGRSEEWRRKKYEHLQAIVEDTEDD